MKCMFPAAVKFLKFGKRILPYCSCLLPTMDDPFTTWRKAFIEFFYKLFGFIHPRIMTTFFKDDQFFFRVPVADGNIPLQCIEALYNQFCHEKNKLERKSITVAL